MAHKAKKPTKRKATRAAKQQYVSPSALARIAGLDDRLDELEERVQRLEAGHSGDPAAHAALAPQPAAEPTGESTSESD